MVIQSSSRRGVGRKADTPRPAISYRPMKEPTELALATEMEAVIDDRGLLTGPRPSVDREKLQHHLREALRLLHVDLEDENVLDTPRRWAGALVTMTSGIGRAGQEGGRE